MKEKRVIGGSVLWHLLMKFQRGRPLRKYIGYLHRRCVSKCYAANTAGNFSNAIVGNGPIGTYVGCPVSKERASGVPYAMVWATVYRIWSQKNTRSHGGEIKIEKSIVKSVRKDVKLWMMFKGSGCNTILNRVLCSNWFVPHSILNESCLRVF